MTDADFLLRLLRIAAEDDDLNLDDLEFAVITGGSRERVQMKPGGGMEVVRDQHVSYWPFEKGEILVLPKEGYREPFGRGRSTAKYDVSEERFGRDWDAAKRRSDEVKAARDRDAFAAPEATR